MLGQVTNEVHLGISPTKLDTKLDQKLIQRNLTQPRSPGVACVQESTTDAELPALHIEGRGDIYILYTLLDLFSMWRPYSVGACRSNYIDVCIAQDALQSEPS